MFVLSSCHLEIGNSGTQNERVGKFRLFLLFSSQPPSVICKTIYLQFILQRCHYLYLHYFFFLRLIGKNKNEDILN